MAVLIRLAEMLAAGISGSKPFTLVVIFYLFLVTTAVVNAIPITFIPDAFSGFTMARNLSGGPRLTFDQGSITTAFHSHWLGITTAVYYLSNSIPTFQYAISSVQTGLVLSGHALLLSVAHRTGSPSRLSYWSRYQWSWSA